METMKIYDLSKISSNGRGTGSQLKENEFSIYILRGKNGSLGNHTLSFSPNAEFAQLNRMFLSVAENTLTGDLFLLFTDESENKGIEIKRPTPKGGSKRLFSNRNAVIRFIADKMGLNYSKGIREIFTFSKNLSKNSDMLTYKIINNK